MFLPITMSYVLILSTAKMAARQLYPPMTVLSAIENLSMVKEISEVFVPVPITITSPLSFLHCSWILPERSGLMEAEQVAVNGSPSTGISGSNEKLI